MDQPSPAPRRIERAHTDQAAANVDAPILSLQNLRIAIRTDKGPSFLAVDGVSFDVPRGRMVGLVGESGCGKTLTALSVLRLHDQPPVFVRSGNIQFEGRNVLAMNAGELRALRGRDIGMVFQDSLAALNPVQRVGTQLQEAICVHHPALRGEEASREAETLLNQVKIPRAKERLRAYPHELSGGMRQRVMIAIAIASKPRLLIADEPTTALDVTVQRDIMELFRGFQRDRGMSILMVTHDLALLSAFADHMVVMYAGKVVENADAQDLYRKPKHPYTRGLLHSLGRDAQPGMHLPTIRGVVPDLKQLPRGCRFVERCDVAIEQCRGQEPPLESVADGHLCACWLNGDGRAPRQPLVARKGQLAP